MKNSLHIPYLAVSKRLLIVNFMVSIFYLSWWFLPTHMDNKYLYFLLFAGEIYHVLVAMGFWLTIWPTKSKKGIEIGPRKFMEPSVDIFITVAGEPIDIVRETVVAAKNQAKYKNFNIYILNDGFVANKDNWRQVENLALLENVNCITRKTPGGAKAGNINNALGKTFGEIVVIFDADMAPQPDFLQKTIGFFSDPQVGFVQTPQYYKNHNSNSVAAVAWEQQAFFYGPILREKEKYNSVFICGTNVAIRRQALTEVGGMNETSIAEDFVTSIYIHQRQWKSHYVPEVLVTGLGPEDLLSYFKQQLRWARGSLEVLFAHNPIFKKNLSLHQKIQYLLSAAYYANGVVVVIDMSMPLFFLFFGLQPVEATTTSFAIFFIPFMFVNLYTLYLVSKASLTFRAISLSLSSWTLQLNALFSILTGSKMGFAVTSKKALEGNFINLAYPHLTYILLAIFGTIVAVRREGLTPSVSTNIVWCLFNAIMFLPYISLALDGSSLFNLRKIAPKPTQ